MGGDRGDVLGLLLVLKRLGISVLLLAPELKMALFPQTQLHLWRREHKAAYF